MFDLKRVIDRKELVDVINVSSEQKNHILVTGMMHDRKEMAKKSRPSCFRGIIPQTTVSESNDDNAPQITHHEPGVFNQSYGFNPSQT